MLHVLPKQETVVQELVMAAAVAGLYEFRLMNDLSNGSPPRFCREGAVAYLKCYLTAARENTFAWCASASFLDDVERLVRMESLAASEEHSDPLFPCSICERVSAKMTISLSFNSDCGGDGANTGLHTTKFSPMLFTSLDMYNQEELICYCSCCGCFQGAVGPLCSICEAPLE
jgi:hypothetical protein